MIEAAGRGIGHERIAHEAELEKLRMAPDLPPALTEKDLELAFAMGQHQGHGEMYQWMWEHRTAERWADRPTLDEFLNARGRASH